MSLQYNSNKPKLTIRAICHGAIHIVEMIYTNLSALLKTSFSSTEMNQFRGLNKKNWILAL